MISVVNSIYHIEYSSSNNNNVYALIHKIYTISVFNSLTSIILVNFSKVLVCIYLYNITELPYATDNTVNTLAYL